MQKEKHKEWRGHSYALYLRGAPGKWNPYPHIRMLHAKGVCIATFVGGLPFSTSPRFLIRTIPKEVFQASSVKCEIKANASATRDFSPKPLQI